MCIPVKFSTYSEIKFPSISQFSDYFSEQSDATSITYLAQSHNHHWSIYPISELLLEIHRQFLNAQFVFLLSCRNGAKPPHGSISIPLIPRKRCLKTSPDFWTARVQSDFSDLLAWALQRPWRCLCVPLNSCALRGGTPCFYRS